MSKHLTEFSKVEGLNNTFIATKGKLRCTALRLTNDSICLFSPIAGLSEQALASLKGLGEVSFILAPNHYHNKGLIEYSKNFPKASIIAPDLAIPRLEKVTGIRFQTLIALNKVLPAHVSIIHTKGLKTGEIWLKIKGDVGNAWLVVDAFCAKEGVLKKAESDTPSLLGTFPKFGVENSQIYLQWASEQILKDDPILVLPCHGPIMKSPQLPKKLTELIHDTFGDQ
jgi:hypothetical protein